MKLVDVFPIPASELAFDFIPTTEKNENGRVCNVFAARTADITEIIAICTKLGIQIQQIVPAQALTLKIAEQNAVSSGIFVERFGDLVNLDVYRYGDLLSSKVVDLHSLDNEISRMRAMTGDGSKILSYNVSLDGTEQKLPAPFISVWPQSELTLDLEPEEYRFERNEKSRKDRHRKCYLIFLAGLAVAALVGDDYMSKSTKIANAQTAYEKKNKIALLKTQNDESKAAEKRPGAELLLRSFEPAQPPGDILKVISSLLPADTWLTGVTFERGKAMILRGTSKKSTFVSTYMMELSKQSRFRDVRLTYVNSGDIDGIPTVQFSITAFPVGNLPLTDLKKKK